MLIGIVVVLLGASALVLYRGFSGNSLAVVSTDPDIAGTQKEIVDLLPYGENLNFSEIKKRGETAKSVEYESVKPAEVGIDKNSLIAPSFGVSQPVPANQQFLDNPTPVRSLP